MPQGALLTEPPLSVRGGAVYPYTSDLEDTFTLVSNFKEPFEMFKVVGKYIWVPRNCAPYVSDVDCREVGKDIICSNLFVPKNEDQSRVVAESVTLLEGDQSHIVQAQTGYGKTYIGSTVAAHFKKRTLILTTKEDIIDQWVDAIRAVLGPVKIGIWRGDVVPPLNCDVVIGLVQSILKGPSRYPKELFNGYGLVICDEVHRMGADQFSQCMWWLPACLRLGLSATPYRKDGKDIVFYSHIGPIQVRARMNTVVPKVLIKHSEWKVPKVIRNGKKVRLPHSPGKTMHVAKLLGRDKKRNQDIAQFVKAAYDKGRHIIVFSEIIEHLELLNTELVNAGVLPHKIGFYVGLDYYEGKGAAAKKLQREQVKSLPVILATFKMASEATDIPILSVAVLGSPRSDVTQIVGRIRREMEGKPQGVVFDIVDSDSTIFLNYAEKRVQWYKSIGSEIKVV